MIVLRLSQAERSREVSISGARVVLGAGPEADVRETEGGWSETEAVITHAGTTVVLERPGCLPRDLRIGDDVLLGRVRVLLVGLLPLGAAAAIEAPVAVRGDGGARPRDPADVPAVFGGYDEQEGADLRALAAGGPFRLVDELAPLPPFPPSPAAGAPPAPLPPPAQRREGSGAAPTASSRPPPRPTTAPPAAAPPSTAPPAGADGRGRRAAAPIRFPTPSFSEELVTQLRRTPYVTLSLAVHALAVLVLSLVMTRPPANPEDRGPGMLVANVFDPADRPPADPDDPDEEDLPAVPDDVAEDLVPPEPPVARMETPTESAPEELAPLDDLSGTALPLGLNPSVNAARLRDRRRRPPPVPRVDVTRPFGKADAPGMNQAAADYVRDALGLGRGRRGERLARLDEQALMVVEGTFDRIEDVLELLGLPHRTVTPLALSAERTPDLSRQKVIFWNCGESLPESRLPLAARRLRAFVEDGGYLFTTDWAVSNVLAKAFPGYLTTLGAVSPLPETVVAVEPAPGAEAEPLLDGVFRPGVQGLWWLEQASFDVQVVDTRRVQMLIRSPDLERRFNRSPAVAVTFRHGRGRVLHLAGHYYQEMGNVAGTIAAHRLVMNFVLERLEPRDGAR